MNERIKFLRETEKTIRDINGILVTDKNNERIFRITGKNNSIDLTLFPEAHHKNCYSIYGRFKHPCMLSLIEGHHDWHDAETDTDNYFRMILQEVNG